eukprot:m.180407 g.180407  ORF g.180407 m.180407 type:complete len:95 (+) comp16854_c1_seq7:3411-3695(+)
MRVWDCRGCGHHVLVIWEILENAKTPYEGMALQQICQYHGQGIRLDVPEDTPHEITRLLESCWQSDYRARPLMSKVERKLNAFLVHNDTDETHI